MDINEIIDTKGECLRDVSPSKELDDLLFSRSRNICGEVVLDWLLSKDQKDVVDHKMIFRKLTDPLYVLMEYNYRSPFLYTALVINIGKEREIFDMFSPSDVFDKRFEKAYCKVINRRDTLFMNESIDWFLLSRVKDYDMVLATILIPWYKKEPFCNIKKMLYVFKKDKVIELFRRLSNPVEFILRHFSKHMMGSDMVGVPVSVKRLFKELGVDKTEDHNDSKLKPGEVVSMARKLSFEEFYAIQLRYNKD